MNKPIRLTKDDKLKQFKKDFDTERDLFYRRLENAANEITNLKVEVNTLKRRAEFAEEIAKNLSLPRTYSPYETYPLC